MNYSRLSTTDRLTMQSLRSSIDSYRLLVRTTGKQYAIDELVRLENQYLERFGECYGRHWGAKEDHRNSDSGTKREASGQRTRSDQRASQGSSLGPMQQLSYHYGVNSRGLLQPWHTTSGTNAFYNTFIEHARRELELETVYEEQPIIAARFATLDRVYDDFILRSLNGMVLDIDSNAICNSAHPKGEKIPFSHCSCGFYAVPADTLYSRHPCTRDSAVVLLVELSGTVIEHELGYRAQHQKILEIQPRRCDRKHPGACNGVRDSIIGDSVRDYYLDPAIRPSQVITLEEVAKQMGIPYGNPSC